MRHGNGPPRGIVCVACHREFFAASLSIHQKTCFQRHSFVDVLCTKCKSTVRSGQYHDHIAVCTGVTQQTQLHDVNTRHTAKKDEEPLELNAPEADGRIRCKKCDRAFQADRIATHQRVCANIRRKVVDPHARQGSYNSQVSNQSGGYDEFNPSKSKRRESLEPATTHPHVKSTRMHAVAIKFGSSSGHIKPISRSDDVPRGRDDRRFDLVLRDHAKRQESSYGVSNSSHMHLSTSTATSASNPLVTTRWMSMDRA